MTRKTRFPGRGSSQNRASLTYYPAKVLQTPAEPVDIENELPQMGGIINKMKMAHRIHPSYGVAAPQIGVSKRLFVYSYGSKKINVMVNPKIKEVSDEIDGIYEGCLSIPRRQIYVERPQKIILTGFNEKGRRIRVEGEGMLAHIFQHEMDHLDGLLILDRAKEQTHDHS